LYWKAAFTSPTHTFIISTFQDYLTSNISKAENGDWRVVFEGKPYHEIHVVKFLNSTFGYALASYTVWHNRDDGTSEHKYYYILITEDSGNTWRRKLNLPINCNRYFDVIFVNEKEVVVIGQCLNKAGAVSTGTILTSYDLIQWRNQPIYFHDQVTYLKKIDYFASQMYVYGQCSFGHFVRTNDYNMIIPLSAEYNSPKNAVGWMGCDSSDHPKCYWSYSKNGEDFIPSNEGNPLESPLFVGSNHHGFWIFGKPARSRAWDKSKIYFSVDGVEFEEQHVRGNENTCLPSSISLSKN
jgi:hypothetical protein